MNAHAQNPFAVPDVRAVTEAGDRRNTAAVLDFAGRNEMTDAHVLRVLSSVQDEAALPTILSMLASPKLQLRIAAAHALGQTLRFSPSALLRESAALDFLSRENDTRVSAELLDAIGRFGSASALDSIAAMNTADPVLMSAQALAIARFAVRSIRSAAGTERVAAIFSALGRKDPGGTGQEHALFAMMRIGDEALLTPHSALVMDAAASPSPVLRMYAAALAAKIKHAETGPLLFAMVNDTDRRVRVQAIRAAASLAVKPELRRQVIHVLAVAMKNADYQTAKSALQAAATLPSADQRMSIALKKSIDTCSSEDLRDDAIRALASISPDFALITIRRWRNDSKPPPAVLQALGIISAKEKRTQQYVVDWLSPFLVSADGPRASAATEAWIACWRLLRPVPLTAKDSAADSTFREGTLRAMRIQSADARNSTAVQLLAEAWSDSTFASPEYIVPLFEALSSFSSKDNVETVIALIRAIAALADSASVQPLRTYLGDENAGVRAAAAAAFTRYGLAVPAAGARETVAVHDWTFLASLKRNPVATVTTNRGLFRFELLYQDAPFTVEAFVQLARKRFYDGLIFHRVVPNFVVQGGDPHGDGSGGPPFTLRSEFSRRSYVRGAVGMASAGKDTEGSQFFVMHTSALHLDGRYTLFGMVTDGMDVVDRLEIGDRLLSVRIDE